MIVGAHTGPVSSHCSDKHGPQISCFHSGKEFAQSRKWALQNRRQEYHPDKSVPQSSANLYRPVSQPSVNRTKPSAAVTLATLNAPLSTDNDYDKSTEGAADLSTNTQSVRSPEIKTFFL